MLSRTVGPLALALAAMLLSTALFARAVDRGNVVWWVVYAVSAALLPLTHPIAASALAAQIVALVIARREVELRLAIPAVALATLESLFFLTAAVVDRADAPDGAGPLSLHDIGLGVGRALGWSPVVVALAVWGVIVLVRQSHASGTGLWQPVLVAGLVLMPLVSVLVAGVALPVYPANGAHRRRRRRRARSRRRARVDPRSRAPARQRRRGCRGRDRRTRHRRLGGPEARTGARRRGTCARRRRHATPSWSCPRDRRPRSPTTHPTFARAASAAARG